MHSNNLYRLTLAFSLLLFISSSADAQTMRQKNAQLRDSLKILTERLDSLQKAYDELLTAPFEPIGMVDTTDDDRSHIFEEDRNTDELLKAWYESHNILPQYSDLENVDDITLSSDIPDNVYIDRLKAMNSFIDLPYNNIVRNYIILYTQKMPEKISTIIGLSFHYLPIFEEIFIENGLPQELKAMAVIESALNPRAVSRVKATGMWQFMYRTATQYGLSIDSYVDERIDPVLSCRAAAKYLKDSYNIFGDWSLAIASYNCGPGNVSKAIRRSGGKTNFWDIYQYLPKETRGYVPAFIAALYTLRYYREHNIVPANIELPSQVDTLHINQNLHFGQISELTGISMDLLRDLNPQYLHDIIPGSRREYILSLPYTYSMKFVEVENEIYNYKDTLFFGLEKELPIKPATAAQGNKSGSSSQNVIYHKVQKGQVLSKIAARYHVSTANIKKWNNLKSDVIRVGQTLKIYTAGAPATTTAKNSSSGSKQTTVKTGASGGYTTYTVKKGDSLWGIAEKFPGVTLTDIYNINGFNRKTKIYPGMVIKIKKQ